MEFSLRLPITPLIKKNSLNNSNMNIEIKTSDNNQVEENTIKWRNMEFM